MSSNRTRPHRQPPVIGPSTVAILVAGLARLQPCSRSGSADPGYTHTRHAPNHPHDRDHPGLRRRRRMRRRQCRLRLAARPCAGDPASACHRSRGPGGRRGRQPGCTTRLRCARSRQGDWERPSTRRSRPAGFRPRCNRSCRRRPRGWLPACLVSRRHRPPRRRQDASAIITITSTMARTTRGTGGCDRRTDLGRYPAGPHAGKWQIAIVYHAHDSELGRVVAVKRLADNLFHGGSVPGSLPARGAAGGAATAIPAWCGSTTSATIPTAGRSS